MMTKFDFKKWVIKHKHGKQSLNEQRGDRDQLAIDKTKSPKIEIAPCENYAGQDLGCEVFQECGTTSPKAYHFMSANFTNTFFHGTFANSPAVNEVVEIKNTNTGVVMFLEYMGVILGTITDNLGNEADWNLMANHGQTALPPTSVRQGCTPAAIETWDCANIGWSWEAPIKPEYKCVINTNGTGTFATEMECLDSMCGDLRIPRYPSTPHM